MKILPIAACALACVAALPARADEELQKKLANPVADMISVPIQLTSTLKTGPQERPQHVVNFQPVYPVRISENWRLINRVIVPVVSSPALTPTQDRVNGLGDITYEGFFSPVKPAGGAIWGVGPMLQMRTATDERLGSGRWAAGPSALVLAQPGKWSVGALVTQLWSFAGDESRAKVNQMQIQPIVSYRLSPVHTVGYLGTITANWEESRSSQRWTVPLGMTYSTLVKPAKGAPINFVVGAGYNVVRPDNAGTWFVRAQATFIFDK
ncbi:hypothetical protein [Comamonas antarctica]|uniref:hypothetical protein n=1 Tax=Comamonas antarctica TaxID=2743470 RepID=UPI0028EFF888|nr:hypothetical protein [Comamonas antarctica]